MSQAQGLKYAQALEVWLATQSNDDFKRIIYRGKLNRNEIVKAIGCGQSAVKTNQKLIDLIKAKEDVLREENILPPLTPKAQLNSDPIEKYDPQETKRMRDNQRSSVLEQSTVELKVQLEDCILRNDKLKDDNRTLQQEVNSLKRQLTRFHEMSEAMDDIGLLPR
jgi:hypothetical protein